jgi:hypothetical protein
MQQAIETKFYGPTNSSGSRIVAKAWAGSKKTHYNHALNADQNHLQAAKALADKMGWDAALDWWRARGWQRLCVCQCDEQPRIDRKCRHAGNWARGFDWFIVEGQCSASPCEAVERDRAL